MVKKEKAEGFYENKYGVFGEKLMTPVGRMAFVNLAKPDSSENPKYGFALLFDKKDETAKPLLKEIQEMAKAMIKQKYGTKPVPTFKRPFLQDGDEKEYTGYPGCWYINCKNADIRDVTIVDMIEPGFFEAGMKVRAQVIPFLGADGFSYKLTGLKFVEDDEVRFKQKPDGASLLKGVDEAVSAAKVNKQSSPDIGSALDDVVGSKKPIAGSNIDLL